MKWPWVSRLRLQLAEERLADRDERITELLRINADLIALNKEIATAPAPPPDETESPNTRLRVVSNARRAFREAAENRFKELQAQKGSK